MAEFPGTANAERDSSVRKSTAQMTRLVPLVVVAGSVLALLAGGGGCGKGLFPEVTATSGTATATPVPNAFLYATNFTDGTVSAFARNTNTGAISLIGKQISAGAVNGPMGVAVPMQNDLVYVVNSADNRVYSYVINLSSGTPGSLTPLNSIAAGTTPRQVAIDSTGNFVYVTNATSRSVSQYVINSDGTLTSLGNVTGFAGQPFGITAHPSLPLVYVSDNTVGLIYTYAIGNNGVLSQVGGPVNSNGGSPGQPGLIALAFDSSQGYLFVDDLALGVVSGFLIQSDGTLAYSGTFGSAQSKPIGIGAVNNGGGSGNNYVITANMTGNFVQPYLRNAGVLTQQGSAPDSNGPTGLAIDTAGLFAYTANSGSGTMALIGINSSRCSTQPLCVISTVASESPANSNAGTQFVATTH